MANDLDELFGGDEGQAQPRTRLIGTLLIVGVVFAWLGLACSSAPGGVLVLAAWIMLETEIDRVDSGFLPQEDRPKLERLRVWARLTLLAVVLLFVVQSTLLCFGFYDRFWGAQLARIATWMS